MQIKLLTIVNVQDRDQSYEVKIFAIESQFAFDYERNSLQTFARQNLNSGSRFFLV